MGATATKAMISVEYMGVDGRGRTVSEAKEDARRKIAEALRHEPRVYQYRGHAVVITWNPDGARVVLTHPEGDGRVVSCSMCAAGVAVESALSHLLTIGREENEYTVPDWVRRELTANEINSLIGTWRRNDAFQRAYRAAPEGVDRHTWACDHQHEFVNAG